MDARFISYFEGEVNDQPSVTIPDRSLSISEILHRFGMGVVPMAQQGYFDETDDDFEEDETRVPGFDFADAFNMEQELKAAEFNSGAGSLEQSNTSDNVESNQERVTENSSEQKTNINDNASV